MAETTRQAEMSAVEFIELMEGYYCPYANDQRKAIVFSVVEALDPQVRHALCFELMRTLGTGWNRAPDWADIDKVMKSAGLEKVISDVRYYERQRERVEFSKADDALQRARENPDPA